MVASDHVAIPQVVNEWQQANQSRRRGRRVSKLSRLPSSVMYLVLPAANTSVVGNPDPILSSCLGNSLCKDNRRLGDHDYLFDAMIGCYRQQKEKRKRETMVLVPPLVLVSIQVSRALNLEQLCTRKRSGERMGWHAWMMRPSPKWRINVSQQVNEGRGAGEL